MDREPGQQGWIRAWAERIEARGLSSAALLLIGAVRPFGLLGSQGLLLLQPMLVGVVSDEVLDQAVTLLEEPGLLERLAACLEGEE